MSQQTANQPSDNKASGLALKALLILTLVLIWLISIVCLILVIICVAVQLPRNLRFVRLLLDMRNAVVMCWACATGFKC